MTQATKSGLRMRKMLENMPESDTVKFLRAERVVINVPTNNFEAFILGDVSSTGIDVDSGFNEFF